MVIPTNIKLVTFDATNTLLKFRIPPWEYYAFVAKRYGYKGEGDDLKIRIRKSYSEMNKEYPNFGKDSISWYEWWRAVVKMTLLDKLPEGTNINEIADTLINDFKTPKCWCKADGSESIINFLDKSGIEIGIISNFDPRLYDILKNIGICDKFKFVLTSYDVGISKPDKGIFEYAQKKCRKLLTPEECLHIGDDYCNDYEGAKGAGWHSILITQNEHKELLNPKCTFKNLNVLHEALINLKLH